MNRYEGKVYSVLAQHPAILILFSFAATILIGALLLMIQGATTIGRVTSFIDALFTSTSAICVTGLAVQDTGTHFTRYGHMIIMLLIQIGGLGIMTISTALAMITGKKLTIRSESLMQNVVGKDNRLDMFRLVRNIIISTLILEGIGALILYQVFYHQTLDIPNSMFSAVFHSVSAFCNAGFGLYSDNLSGYVFNWTVNLVITSLIILGGIGFATMEDIRYNFLPGFRFNKLKLHTKIVLTTTFFLLVFGTICLIISEYNNTMQGFSNNQRFLSAYFQSVTCRTAGFNTIDISRLTNASVLICIFLMYVGASPGSTGGGIKTTSFAIIVLSAFAYIRGSKDVTSFGRKIPEELIKRVLALLAISLAFIILLVFILMMVEPFRFDKILFEAVSAFGTVGLSMGITPQLSSLGKVIIIILMYIGRVGPLTFIFALSERKTPIKYLVPEEKVDIG